MLKDVGLYDNFSATVVLAIGVITFCKLQHPFVQNFAASGNFAGSHVALTDVLVPREQIAALVGTQTSSIDGAWTSQRPSKSRPPAPVPVPTAPAAPAPVHVPSGTNSTGQLCTGSQADSDGEWVSLPQPSVPPRWPLPAPWPLNATVNARFRCNGTLFTKPSRFMRRSGCIVADINHVVHKLMKRNVPLFFVGDSALHHLFFSVLQVAQLSGFSTSSMDLYKWRCFGRSDRELLYLFETFGSSFFRSLSDAEKHPEPAAGVLFINIGLWYNLYCTSEVDCSFEDSVGKLLNALGRGDESVLQVSVRHETKPNNVTIDGWRESVCDRIEGPGDMLYAKDLLRLARFVQRNRKRLPAQIVWVDSTPQHFGVAGTFSTFALKSAAQRRVPPCQRPLTDRFMAWRNQMALHVWSAISPSTLFVRTKELFMDRFEDHSGMFDSTVFQDCTHYCLYSKTWHEYVSTVLTALLADGRRRSLQWAM